MSFFFTFPVTSALCGSASMSFVIYFPSKTSLRKTWNQNSSTTHVLACTKWSLVMKCWSNTSSKWGMCGSHSTHVHLRRVFEEHSGLPCRHWNGRLSNMISSMLQLFNPINAHHFLLIIIISYEHLPVSTFFLSSHPLFRSGIYVIFPAFIQYWDVGKFQFNYRSIR